VSAEDIVNRVDTLFDQRKEYEALWETAYKYIAPERALIYNREKRSPGEIQDEVFDSTAIDAAERLTNLIMSGLIPPWQSWFRVSVNKGYADMDSREQIRGALEEIEKLMTSMLSVSNFYQEMQPVILDRIVGGTCGICLIPDYDERKLRFKNIPLGELAIQEDDSGRIVSVARKFKLSVRQLVDAYGDRVPQAIREKYDNREASKANMDVVALNDQNAMGLWRYSIVLKKENAVLFDDTKLSPYMFVSRWAKVPGSVYGRGPGLRALSDVRALNKIKELSLKNAAKAVAGVYTVVDDGVINPYTLTFEPGTFMSVGSNDRQNPTIAELPVTGDFNVSMFQMDDLRQAIEKVFLADNYGPTDRTPMTATEVQQRTRIIAQDMGATISRMQQEMLMPILQAAYQYMAEMEMVPPEIQLDGQVVQIEFVSQLAQAQWAIDEQNLLEFTQTAIAFGDVDPKAGLIIDVHRALGQLAEIKHISPEVLRSQQQIQQLMEEAAQAQAQAQGEMMEGGEQGGMV